MFSMPGKGFVDDSAIAQNTISMLGRKFSEVESQLLANKSAKPVPTGDAYLRNWHLSDVLNELVREIDR